MGRNRWSKGGWFSGPLLGRKLKTFWERQDTGSLIVTSRCISACTGSDKIPWFSVPSTGIPHLGLLWPGFPEIGGKRLHCTLPGKQKKAWKVEPP